MEDGLRVYCGDVLSVSVETDALLHEKFPEVDRPFEYRMADSWLSTHPKSRWPKKHQRFLLNWFRRAARREHDAEKRMSYKDEIVRRELNVGGER